MMMMMMTTTMMMTMHCIDGDDENECSRAMRRRRRIGSCLIPGRLIFSPVILRCPTALYYSLLHLLHSSYMDSTYYDSRQWNGSPLISAAAVTMMAKKPHMTEDVLVNICYR